VHGVVAVGREVVDATHATALGRVAAAPVHEVVGSGQSLAAAAVAAVANVVWEGHVTLAELQGLEMGGRGVAVDSALVDGGPWELAADSSVLLAGAAAAVQKLDATAVAGPGIDAAAAKLGAAWPRLAGAAAAAKPPSAAAAEPAIAAAKLALAQATGRQPPLHH
jgi:hypothetical protein